MKLTPLALAIIASSAFATTHTVDTTDDAVDNNIGDGVCATEVGNCSLRAAIQESNHFPLDRHVINLPDGRYLISMEQLGEDESAAGDLDINSNISIIGESSANTIIDGQQLDRIFDINTTNNGASLNLERLTLTNGMSFDSSGGAINNESILNATNVIISNSRNDPEDNVGQGGAIYIATDAHTTLNNVTIELSNANSGGAIHNAGHLDIANSTFNNNSAVNGAAIASSNALTSVLTVFENNVAAGYGGAVHNSEKSSFTETSFIGNQATHGGGIYNTETGESSFTFGEMRSNAAQEGGAVYNDGDATLSSASILNNAAAINAGAILNNLTLSILHTTINNNTTNGSGGALFNTGTATLENLSIFDNVADLHGGAIYNEGGSTRLEGVSILNNTGVESAIYSTSGLVNVEKSILHSNLSTINCLVSELPNEIFSLGYNLFNEYSCNPTPDDEVANEIFEENTQLGLQSIITPSPTSLATMLVDDGPLSDQCLRLSQNLKVRKNELCDAGAFERSNIDANIGRIGFAANEITVSELLPNPNGTSENIIKIPVNRTAGADGAVTISYQTVGISANESGSPLDFENKAGSLEWTHGDTQAKEISVSIIDDDNVEETESFKIVLSGITIGEMSNREIVVNINDNDVRKGTFQFEESNAELLEGQTLEVDLLRTDYTIGEVDVKLDLLSTVAIDKNKVSIAPSTVTFKDGEILKTVSIYITDDNNYTPEALLTLGINENNNNIKIGETNELSVSIIDDEMTPTFGIFSMSAQTDIIEGQSNTVSITRSTNTGEITGSVRLRTELTKQGSILETNYISFGENELQKDFDVKIEDNEVYEEPHSITLNVFVEEQSGGSQYNTDAEIATQAVTFDVTDNDEIPQAGTFGFSENNVLIDGEGRTETITINRTGGTVGEFSFTLDTLLGTADNQDFTLSTQAIYFAEGETEKQFSITSTVDTTFEVEPETFSITLTPLQDNVIVSNDTIIVTLQDSEESQEVLEQSGGAAGLLSLLLIPFTLIRRRLSHAK